MKIYLVTDGNYSDYKVLCVCSTMEKAMEAKRLYDAYNEIEEFNLDFLPDHPRGMFLYFIKMDLNGNVEICRQQSIEYGDLSGKKWNLSCDRKSVIFIVWGEDKKHAIKIANERRAELKAMGKL